MKLKHIYIFVLTLILSSCTKGFNDIKNPNSSTTVPSSVLFTGISRATFAGPQEAGQQAAQFYVSYSGGALDEITYFFQRNSFSEFDILRNVERLRIETVVGDIIFDGSLLKWKKLVNTFRLRVLMSLSLKTGDTDLGVINQFKMIYDNPSKYPIMTSNVDNAAFKYYDVTGAKHFWATVTAPTTYRLSTTLGDVLKKIQTLGCLSFLKFLQVAFQLHLNQHSKYQNHRSHLFYHLSTTIVFR